MEKIIKVDRVCSVNEAQKLQSLGVDIIGVSLNDTPIYSDNRVVDIESIFRINEVLKSSKLAVEIPHDYIGVLELIDRASPSYVQVSGTGTLPIEKVKKIKENSIGIVYGGIEASYEDDPSWILSNYSDKENLNASFYQVDLLGDVENSWEFFKSECPNYPEELQILDIIKLAEQNPFLITLDFNKENISEIIRDFSSVKGISLTLSEKVNREDIHCFSYQSVLDILEVMKKERV